MARVLVLGESWFTYTVHQKGFDAFYTADYTEGGGPFLEAVTRAGHEVTYVPSHLIHSQVPDTPSGLAAYDVIVISDVGANSFQLHPDTFTRSARTSDKTEAMRSYVQLGGGLLMVGGYLTFSGIDAKARWGRSPLAAALPVAVLDRDDRVELSDGSAPKLVGGLHEVTAGLDEVWPNLLGLNEVGAKDSATVLAECASYPLLVVGSYGRGRSAAFTSDIAPHWAPPTFLDWPGYAVLWDQLIRWLSRGDA